MIFLELFYTFFVIGLFTIGGGYAMLPLIQHQVCTAHQWITEQEFTDMVAISQMTPGPIGINSATFIGYSVTENWLQTMQIDTECWWAQAICTCGSLTSTIAVVLPSFIIVLALCHVYKKFCRNSTFTGVMSGLKPTVAGLIGAAAVILITPGNFPDWRSWAIFAASFLAAMFTKINPILLLLASAAVGIVLF